MTLRLHGNPFSSSARRPLLVARHLDLPVELNVIRNLRDPREREPLVAINPNAKIPVLEHDGFVLWESNAIMQYLAELAPEQTVWPSEPRARADVSRWLFWGAQHWSPPIGRLTWERWMKGMFGGGPPDEAVIATADEELARFAAVLDQQLAGRTWVTGDTLTIADFSLATPLMREREASLGIARWPAIAAWFARVQQLPAWKATA